jgi:hypothetical protein
MIDLPSISVSVGRERVQKKKILLTFGLITRRSKRQHQLRASIVLYEQQGLGGKRRVTSIVNIARFLTVL